MQHATRETVDQTSQLQPTLSAYVKRITEELETLTRTGDWGAIRSVLRVLDAHSRANELRAQGQPARAHLWLVGVGRKRQKPQPTKSPTTPRPAA